MAAIESSGVFASSAKGQGWLRGISVITAVSVFGLVVLGGVVRVTDSGLGCPDWPLCHGNIFPPLELTAIIEYTHRLVASAIVSPLILVTCGLVWVFRRHEGWLVVPSTLAVVLLLGQALLGGVTVLRELPGEIVAAHLALGEALLACMVLVAVVAFRGPLSIKAGKTGKTGKTDGGSSVDRFPLLAFISAIGVYALIMSGSLVFASGATGACVTWPLCQGEVFPASQLAMIHMGHRFVAVIIGGFLVYVLHLGIRGRDRPAEIRLLSMIVAALFSIQVIVGAVTVWAGFAIQFTGLHLAMATLVWAGAAALAMVSFTPRSAPGFLPGSVNVESPHG